MQLSNVQYLHQSKQNGSIREEGCDANIQDTTCSKGRNMVWEWRMHATDSKIHEMKTQPQMYLI